MRKAGVEGRDQVGGGAEGEHPGHSHYASAGAGGEAGADSCRAAALGEVTGLARSAVAASVARLSRRLDARVSSCLTRVQVETVRSAG